MPTTRDDGVGQRAAGVAGVERGVGLDDVLDHPRRPAVAGGQRAAQPADHAGGDRAGQAERVADGDHELADPQRRRVAEHGGRRASAPRARTTARSDSGSAPTTSTSASVPSPNTARPRGAPADDVRVGQQQPVVGDDDGRAGAAAAVAAGDLQGGDVRGQLGGDGGDDAGVGVQGRLDVGFGCRRSWRHLSMITGYRLQ